MSSSDEEGEYLPDCVTDYELLDHANEHVSLAYLPFFLHKDEVIGNGKTRLYLSGSYDNGLQKIFKEVMAWRFELSYAQPEISVLCKGTHWVKLHRPKRIYAIAYRSILITVHCLHFVKHNLEVSEESMWSQLSRVFCNYEVPPSEVDCMNHVPVIKDAAENDQTLKDSEFIRNILSGQPMERKVLQVESIRAERPEFIVDEDTDDPYEDDDLEEDLFDTCCSICDNGGDILCCEGSCMRSFHAKRQTGDSGEETCEGLGLSEAQIRAIPHFLCKNCKRQRHQCFICGKLGSSDVTSNAEVFPCIAGNCGRFYHPKCVSKELHQPNDTPIENLEKNIAEGESFVCPAHRCFSCKQVENRMDREMQFAVCRRCPKSYHRKCLPREILFDTGADMEIMPRAWDGLLPKRILIYCVNHLIVPHLGTPLRNRISFPNMIKVKTHASEKLSIGSIVAEKKRKVDHSNLVFETSVGNTQKQAASEPPQLVDKYICGPSFDGQKKAYSSKLANDSTAHLKYTPKPFTSSTVYWGDPPIRHNKFLSEKNLSATKPSNSNLYGEKFNALHSAKPLTKKQDHCSAVTDIEVKRRVTSLIEKVNASFTMNEFMKREKPTSIYHVMSKNVNDKSLTTGKVEKTVKAARDALKKLENGGSIDDARAVCNVDMLRKVPMWKSKLRLYIGPFLHGEHYSSFGRHFTKSDKLQEIVDRLHNYVLDGDMIVDFCCGANEFSCKMKEKLDSVGKKKCSYKNFDLFPPKNDFNFEQRDWFTVNPNNLPRGSQLVMGLNPPFGYKGSLANKFINKAFQLRPKLLILIVPPKTFRLDHWNKKEKLKYDLLWEDRNLLAGELPGAHDAHEEHISQWNNTTPPLYLWSHPDWTRKHMEIANQCGHSEPRNRLSPDRQPPSPKNLPEDQQDVRGDFINVFGNLPNVVDSVPGPMVSGNVYSHHMSSNVYGHHMNSNVYGRGVSSYVYGDHTSDAYGRIDPLLDKYINIPSRENLRLMDMRGHMGRYGTDSNLVGRENVTYLRGGWLDVEGDIGRNGMDSNLTGRENATYYRGVNALEDDMDLPPN